MDDIWTFNSDISSSDRPSIEAIFPLPEHDDPALCRDEFLRSILPETVEEEENQRESVKVEAVVRDSMTAEGMAVLRMMQSIRPIKQVDTLSQYRLSLTGEQLAVLYKMCLVQFQKAATRFLFVRLRKQIQTVLLTWPGEVDPIPHKLFNWKKDLFVKREKVNRSYLGVLVMERSQHDLDCSKFCIDLLEAIMFIEQLQFAFNRDIDICQTSEDLDDANYQVTSTMVQDLADSRAKYNRLAATVRMYENLTESESVAQMVAEYDTAESIMLIELRYRINWLRSCGEQNLLSLDAKERVYRDEIEELERTMKSDQAMFAHIKYVYQFQIDNFKMSIDAWQVQLDNDLEAAELMVSTTKSQLAKARDDLKFYQEQAEMFKRRVAEVLEIIEKEERAASSARSTRSPKVSIKEKKGRKSKKKKK